MVGEMIMINVGLNDQVTQQIQTLYLTVREIFNSSVDKNICYFVPTYSIIEIWRMLFDVYSPPLRFFVFHSSVRVLEYFSTK